MTNNAFKELHPLGSEVDYHGRPLIIRDYTVDGYAVCLDTATDEIISVSIEELIEQNYE